MMNITIIIISQIFVITNIIFSTYKIVALIIRNDKVRTFRKKHGERISNIDLLRMGLFVFVLWYLTRDIDFALISSSSRDLLLMIQLSTLLDVLIELIDSRLNTKKLLEENKD